MAIVVSLGDDADWVEVPRPEKKTHARMWLEHSGRRWDFGGEPSPEGWRTTKSWKSNGENFKPETMEKAITMLHDAVQDTNHSPHGTTHAWWRLRYDDGKGRVITLTSGETVEIGGIRVIAGPLRQGADRALVDRDAIWRAVYGDPEEDVPEELPLPTLDETPVPTGTVVEVLDEWGLPTGSTEVT